MLFVKVLEKHSFPSLFEKYKGFESLWRKKNWNTFLNFNIFNCCTPINGCLCWDPDISLVNKIGNIVLCHLTSNSMWHQMMHMKSKYDIIQFGQSWYLKNSSALALVVRLDLSVCISVYICVLILKTKTNRISGKPPKF